MSTFVNINEVRTNGNVRREVKPSPSLVASILQHGIIQPLVVYRATDDEGHEFYALIAGHRRLEAAKQAEMTDVPIDVRAIPTSDEVLGLQVSENLHRENLSDWELAQASINLKELGLKQADVSKQMGVSKKDVSALQRAGSLTLEDDTGSQFNLAGLLDLADAAKATELPAEDIAFQITSREARDVREAVRNVQYDNDEAVIIDEIAVLSQEWADKGIKVVTVKPDLTGKKDQYGYEKKDPNVKRIGTDWRAHLEIDPSAHESEPCHVVFVKNGHGLAHTEIEYWCINARNHSAKGKSEVKAPAGAGGGSMSDKDKEQMRKDREAKNARRLNAAKFLVSKTKKQDRYEWALDIAQSVWREDNYRTVVLALIELEEIEKRPKGVAPSWYKEKLIDWLDDRIGDDEDKRAEWMLQAILSHAYIENPAWAIGRLGLEVIETE